jgi:hypothetical protein
MPYATRFKLADDFIAHLDGAIGGIADPFIQSRYVGFVAVSAATVFELAIKDIFSEFAAKKHKLLASFVQGYFDQINGQIGQKRIEEKYLPLFGKKYVDRFRGRLKTLELQTLKADRVSVKSSYSNLLTWRHEFAHEGVIPANATYDEVKKAYRYACSFVHCLARTMTR